MIAELHIQNFAIIDSLTLSLQEGLIILTGETGAGKSIVLDAVELLLGQRAETSFIRSGADRAYVEGVFRPQGSTRAAIHAHLQAADLLDDPDYLVLAREIRRNGRSVARINGRVVTLGLLRQIGALLVDIHGQSEHLSLLKPQNHLPLLDRFAHTAPLLTNYQETYRQWQQVGKEIETLQTAQREAARRADLLAYQIEEIEAANLETDEEDRLRQERDRLANAEALSRYAQEIITLLDEGTPETPAAADLLGQASHAMQQLARYDSSQSALEEDLQLTLETISEIAHRLRIYQENIAFNPSRLAAIEERLDLIQRLKRKYGDTIAEVLDYATTIRAELDTLTHAEERLDALQEQEATLRHQLEEQAKALSQARQKAAQTLNAAVEKELTALQMPQARFKVAFRTQGFTPQGADRVEFLIAPNPGEGFKPLAKIASGGETARLMLALKNVLAQADEIPTLIFDEIDQGIGGRLGHIVGYKLWQLARQHQVICVTHLPQLAAFGDQHLRVEKRLDAERTRTEITPLQGEQRLRELAQMLGGTSQNTLNSARELLQKAHEKTHTPNEKPLSLSSLRRS